MKNIALPFLIVLLLVSCKQAPPPFLLQDSIKKAVGENGMVVSAHPLASEIGLQVLKNGGNAIDAAVAIQYALAVVYPGAGNLGGGGFMIYRDKEGNAYSLDFREKAPKSAFREMYLDENGEVTKRSIAGALAAGVPGTVAGIFEMHKKYGKEPMSSLIEPSIVIAQNGFEVTEYEAKQLNSKAADFKEHNRWTIPFLKATPWKKAEILKQPDLAKTLIRIQENGQKGFYEGPVADAIVNEMKAGGGMISLEDLKAYQAIWRKPIKHPYKGYEIISMPPPSSGGIALAQMLEMVEPYPLKEMGFHSKEAVHLMVEAERRAFADRAEYLGDADFHPVPVSELLSEAYLKSRMADFDPENASSSEQISAGKILGKESLETTHFSIIDKEGNSVSITTTLNSSYGSKVVVKGGGFFLNNEMDDFSAKPGTPNLYGLVGGEANAIEAEKRMLSSMTPTIVEKDGEVFMVLGTPGGSTIITSVFQVILNVIEFDLSLEEAVQSPRFHHQWLPDEIQYEKDAFKEPVYKWLNARGHQFKEKEAIGKVEAILVLDGQYEGAADTRADDHACGF